MTIAAEKAIIEQTQAAIAAGEDPFGDNEGFETTTVTNENVQTADAAAADNTPGTDPTGGDGADSQNGSEVHLDLDAAALEAIANGGDESPVLPMVADPLNFNVNAPADYKTARAALVAEETEAFAKVMGGEIDATEYAAIKARVMDGLEELSAQRIRAETLQEVNTQSAAQSQAAVIQALITRASRANELNYAADEDGRIQFDRALSIVAAEPKMAGKPFSELVNEAHRTVLALRGISEKTANKTAEQKAAEATAADAARRPAGSPPITLRGLPSAATANTGGSITDQLARLSGQDYQTAFAKLTPAQRASLLDE